MNYLDDLFDSLMIHDDEIEGVSEGFFGFGNKPPKDKYKMILWCIKNHKIYTCKELNEFNNKFISAFTKLANELLNLQVLIIKTEYNRVIASNRDDDYEGDTTWKVEKPIVDKLTKLEHAAKDFVGKSNDFDFNINTGIESITKIVSLFDKLNNEFLNNEKKYKNLFDKVSEHDGEIDTSDVYKRLNRNFYLYFDLLDDLFRFTDDKIKVSQCVLIIKNKIIKNHNY